MTFDFFLDLFRRVCARDGRKASAERCDLATGEIEVGANEELGSFDPGEVGWKKQVNQAC